jgi:hypothetical protein
MMSLSRLKPIEEICSYFSQTDPILVLACNGCEESFGNSETERLKMLEKQLEENGVSVNQTLTIDFLCEPILVRHWLSLTIPPDSIVPPILTVCCGIGVQVVSKVRPGQVFPACDTVSMGGRFGQAWGNELCRECGQCILPETGGICPMTACSKGLLNGPCGGTQEGRCEVFPETRSCGWYLIHERLTLTGRTDLLTKPPLIKDHSRSEPPPELISLRNSILEKENESL